MSIAYIQVRSGRAAWSIAVVGVAVSEPKKGTVELTPHASRGVMLTKCTARVSPGRAPSTNHGPVCGLSWRGSHTWLGRSSAERTRPAKQSMVQVCSTVPGRTWVTGAAPPNAKVSVAGSASGSGAQVQTSKPSSAIGHLLLLLALIMHFAGDHARPEVHDRREVHDQRRG